MARVTEDEVKAIIDTELTVDQVAPFLAAANIIVTNTLTDQEYGEDTLEEIERWLAAHLVAIRDPRIKSQREGDASASYFGKDGGANLDATPYGQQVKLLDYRGVLASVSRTRRPATLHTLDP